MPPEDTGESIGRTAGRWVRAAGLAGAAAYRELEKERKEREAAEAAAQAAAATQAAAPAAAPAPPPAETVAPVPAARPAPAARRRGRRPDPEPNRVLDGFLYWLWIVSFWSAALMVIQIDLLLPKSGGVRRGVELALGVIFLLEGWLLVNDTWQTRRRLLLRLLWGKNHQRHELRGWRVWLARLGQETLILCGIVFIGLALWVGARGLFGGTL